MAVKKTSGAAKKERTAAKSGAKGAAKKAAPKATAAKKAAPAKASAAKKAAPKKAAKKASPGPVKLTSSQGDLLRKVSTAGEDGYLSDKKAEARSLEALRERKLIKRGAKDKASGNYRYIISSTGKKHPESSAPAGGGASPSAPPASS